LAVGERLDALLREGDQLDGDPVLDLLPKLEEGAKRRQVRITDVDMAAYEEDAVGELPAEDLRDPVFDVLDRQRLDALPPDRNALEERTALVVPGLADREHGV